MNVLLLCGSVAKKSHTFSLLKYIQTILESRGDSVTLWDLKTDPIPFVLPEYHKDPTQHPDQTVRDFVAAIANADIVVLGSSLYHGSYTGVLKNALDNLHSDAFNGKWVSLVGNASGPRASHVEFSHLRQVVNTMGGYCAQTQIGTCVEDYEETPNGYTLVSESMKQRCERLVAELERIMSK